MVNFNFVLPEIRIIKRVFAFRHVMAGGMGLIAVGLAGLLNLALGGVAYASTSVVTTTLDSGAGSLREAITTANVSGGTITFGVNGTIVLTGSLPAINIVGVTIDGSGHAITISGANQYQVMVVNGGATLNLQSITIANGVGAIYCNGFCYYYGGGIFNSGTLTMTNSTIVSNTSNPGDGGGITNFGILSVNNSTFSSNSAGGEGGGIYNYLGTLVVTNSIFSGNTATGGGGGIYNDGTLTVTNSTFTGNNSANSGGGIMNFGILSVNNSTFSSNGAGGEGGGIFNATGINVTNSTFSSNTATFMGGGIKNVGTLTMINSTFSDNSVQLGGLGGGILNTGILSVTNSIIANSTFGGDCYSYSQMTGSHNLIKAEGGDACFLTDGTNGNIIGLDPELGPLANNGGSTLTFAPLPGSPAINHATIVGCPEFDQRGVSRPQGGTCDIGAVESLIWPRAYLPLARR